MYSVIIIDDEKTLREGLGWFITTEKKNFSVAGEFDDGVTAIEFLKNNRADVIITDIRMSKVSGLDVVKYIRENNIKTKIIIISGYKEFEYVQTAIKYNVDYYLTKPTRYSELSEIFSLIEADFIKEQQLKDKQEHEKELRDFIVFEFISDIYYKTISEEVFKKKLSLIDNDFSLRDSSYIVIQGIIEDYEKFLLQKYSYGSEDFISAINNMIFQLTQEKNVTYYPLSFNKGVFCYVLFSNNSGTNENFIDIVNDVILKIKKNIYELFGLKNNIGILNCYNSLHDFFNANSVILETGSAIKKVNEYNIIQKAKEYIIKNIGTDISLEEVAKYVHLNSVYFSRYFKVQTGEKFSAYIVNLRIEIAISMLKEGKYKIKDIGKKVGYTNKTYFSKLFKQQTGYTPTQYIVEVLGNNEV